MPNRLAIVFHPSLARYDPDPYHPESPLRLARLNTTLGELASQIDLRWQPIQPALPSSLEVAHPVAYWEAITAAAEAEGTRSFMDRDVRVCRETPDALLTTAGCVQAAVKAVIEFGSRHVFAAVRPAGHHAGPSTARGFCILNGAALAARWLQEAGRERIAIIDWDAHHGNGTQEVFEADPSVFFMSWHQNACYPFSGLREETGTGEGKGTTLNIPLPSRSTLDAYRTSWKAEVQPALKAFAPDALVISAGFDAHKFDPLSNLALMARDYAEMTQWLVTFSEDQGGLPIISILEGGYYLPALTASVKQHLLTLAGAQVVT